MATINYFHDGVNLQYENTFMAWQLITDPTSDQYRLKQDTGMPFDSDGFGWVNGAYAIACTSKFGVVGDYIDWTLENGTTIRTIIADEKDPNDPNFCEDGHFDSLSGYPPWTNLSVIEYVVDQNTWYGTGRTVDAMRPQLASRAVSAMWVGNYWNNPPSGGSTNNPSTISGSLVIIEADKHYLGNNGRVTYLGSYQPDGYVYFNDDTFYRCKNDGSDVQLKYIDQTMRWVLTNQLTNVVVNKVTGGALVGGGATGSNVAPAASVEAAIQWAIGIANDPNYGYSWTDREGTLDATGRGSFDCSSFMYHAFEGFGVIQHHGGSSGSTLDMVDDFTACGFTWMPGYGNDTASLQRGDILLNIVEHTELYLGNGQDVAASKPENGDVWVNEKGDQTGEEIYVKPWYAYPWDGILRYTG